VVIVREGTVVGEGYHEKAGRPHAEINALKSAGDRAKGATLYVTLEPCPIYGRTPPCTEAIIAAGISRVVVGLIDPNPEVSGRGLEDLKKAGIRVENNVLSRRIRKQNEAYIKFITTGRPFVLLKVAMSLDGKIATKIGDSRWITGEESREVGHRLRDEYDAVMVGVGTIIRDNPRLDVRLEEWENNNPLRVIIDSSGRIPLKAQVVETASEIPTLVATTQRISVKKADDLRKKGAEVLVLGEKRGRVDLAKLLTELGKREIVSVLLEGGSILATSAIEDSLVDKFILFVAPKLIGGNAPSFLVGEGIEKIQEAKELEITDVKQIGKDVMIEAYPKQSTSLSLRGW
jgi:diaminohydroxyphosphoribosylaminopyrimidine deaminase/5-amino-6-(5-phosphoribosylamino)uracil reductase